MKREVAQLWAKELRCGNWEQGTLFLEHSQTYCVLGILANLAALHGICEKTSQSGNIYRFDGDMFSLPPSVQKWAGIKQPMNELKLKEWNDKGKSFTFLANWIDKNWETL